MIITLTKQYATSSSDGAPATVEDGAPEITDEMVSAAAKVLAEYMCDYPAQMNTLAVKEALKAAIRLL
jgi:hypothetical protein